MDTDGVQYEYYAAKGVTALHSPDPWLFNYSHWSRSATPRNLCFRCISYSGNYWDGEANKSLPILPNHPCFLSAPPRKRGFFTSKRMVLWYNPTTPKRPTYKRGK